MIGSDRVALFDRRPGRRLHTVPALNEWATASRPMPALPDWSRLVDLVHAAAHHLRQIEARALDQDRSSRQALQRARDAVVAADRQARQAETLADAAGHRAEARITAAEAKAGAAEAWARAADARAGETAAWLARVQEVILSEFPDLNERVAA